MEKRIKIENALVGEDTTASEAFQNNTLRPIIKSLHQLIIIFMNDYFIQKKGRFFNLTDVEKPAYLLNVFKTDTQLKLHLRAMVIGNFTAAELVSYLTMKAPINKRINEILLKRILDSQFEFKEN